MSVLLTELNKTIKKEANQILHEKKLFDILTAFGNPHLSGSYSLDLMTWRDLDIYLEVEEMTEEEFFWLGTKICKTLSPLRMHFRNEKLAKSEGLPNGLYWGIYLGDERKGAWKIDIWAISTVECKRLVNYCKNIKQQLDASTISSILEIKSQCWQDPEYRRSYGSGEIYDAVLNHAIKDVISFKSHLNRAGKWTDDLLQAK